jgi:hypothetical protein
VPGRISDVVWHQLDPRAGALGNRTIRRNWWVGTGLTVASVALVVAWYLGLVVPRLEGTDGMGAEIYDSGWIRVTVSVTNAGVVPVTVVGAGRSDPGLQFLRADGTFPTTLRPGGSMTVGLQYQLTDCAAVPEVSSPVAVEVRRWWGGQTVDLQTRDDWWQRRLVDHICDPQ